MNEEYYEWDSNPRSLILTTIKVHSDSSVGDKT